MLPKVGSHQRRGVPKKKMSDEQNREILMNISRAIQNAHRCFENEDVDCRNVLTDLRTAQRSLELVKESIQIDSYTDITSTIHNLSDQIEVKIRASRSNTAFTAPREVENGRCGRPKVIISEDQLRLLHSLNYSVPQMAEQFACSPSTVYKKMYSIGLRQRDKYCSLTERELDTEVQTIQTDFPNAGSVMMSGLLKGKGTTVQRKRLRESIERVSPIPVVQRLAKTVSRRRYSVQMSNSLWHIDGHMKLIRWGISTHGCIDGYSRLITYLKASSNNKAKTVLENFVKACTTYGIPSRVRSDHGGENLMVALFVSLVNGEERHSIITGRSVHNQRIERLWRDVFTQVIEKFYNEFYAMEDKGELDPENQEHVMSLQMAYLQEINRQLESFRNGWNNHQISTENSQSPKQLWLSGILKNINCSSNTVCRSIYSNSDLGETFDERIRHYGLDPAQFQEQEEEESSSILSNEQTDSLLTAIAGLDTPILKYNKALEYIAQLHLETS